MDTIPYPTSLAEVEALIYALYARTQPSRVQQVEKLLQQLQRSEQGWQIAESLLSRQDPDPDGYLKFFGALTITVKLNTDSSSLSDEQAVGLLQNLVGWFLQAVEESGGKKSIVLLKLSSALSTYFIHFSHLWKHCVSHLVHSMDAGRCIPLAEFDNLVPIWMAASSLPSDKLEAVIRFASDLADNVAKTDPKSAKFADVRTYASGNIKDVAEIIFIGMDYTRHGANAERAVEDTMLCFQSWVAYARSISDSNDSHEFRLLRPVLEQFTRLLSVDNLWEPVLFRLVDIFELHPRFLTEEYHEKVLNVFQGEHFQRQFLELLQGDMDNVPLVSIMISYGIARMTHLVTAEDEGSQLLLSDLVRLTGCRGYPPVEDEIFGQALEFWSTYLEEITDELDEEESGQWFDKAMAHLNKVLHNCWVKSHWPPIEAFMQWDSDDRAKFVQLRQDVADLLEALFPMRGLSMVSVFVQSFATSLSTDSASWGDIEASAFFIASLADCINDDGSCDEMISNVFLPEFFTKMLQGPTVVPLRVRHTCLRLIERYSWYFLRHTKHLPSALNLLFGGLGDPALGGESAKYIANLCTACKDVLTGEVPAFLEQYGNIYLNNPLDPLAEEKVILGIATIIQAIPDTGAKLTAFTQLFNFARYDIERSMQLAAHPEQLNLTDPLHRRGVDLFETGPNPSAAEVSLYLALRALRSISGMAKGMRSSYNEPIDVDTQVSPWQISNELAAIQNEILKTLNQVLVTFPKDGDVIAVTCSIFRAGFSENEPGPFVFPPSVVSSFFTSLTIDTPRIGTAVFAACSFLSCLFHGPPEYLVPTLSQLLPWVISLLRSLPDSTADTELTQHSIDLIRRLISKEPRVFFQLQPPSLIGSFFLFTLEILNGSEPLPKAAAAEFWTEFLALRSEDPVVQNSISDAMQHLGPLIARSLMRNIGGEAMRSELDKLSEPLKKLVVQQPRAQAWLEAALLAADFPSDKVSPADRKVFLRKIINLRGARTTNQVVRDFWLACRGSNYAYAS